MESKLYETLSKCKIQLKGAVTNYAELDKKFELDGNPYKLIQPNEHLETHKSGWLKYSLFIFDKVHSTDNKYVKVGSILHIIHPIEDDIIIARVAKYSPKTKNINVRYIIYQKNKEQLCSNLKELHNVISKTYNYSGRILTMKDFVEGK